MTVISRFLAGTLAAVLAAVVPVAAFAKDYVIAISPEIESIDTRKAIGASTMTFLFSQSVKLGDRIIVVNALDQTQVAVFTIPIHRLYENEAPRRKHLEKPISDFIRFIAKAPTATAPDRAAAINVPKLMANALSLVPGTSGDAALTMLIIGNPIHTDALQPRFSMLGARVPSDGHLNGTIEESVYGLQGAGKPLENVRVHWATLGADWLGDLHEARVKRMWAAYVDLRGGTLFTFKPDVRSVFDAFGGDDAKPILIEPALDRGDKRLTMNIVRRDAENRDAEQRLFESKEVKREPVVRPAAKLRIGLRWDRGTRADIDLYAKTIPAKHWIYFGETETIEGRFYKYDGDPMKPSKGLEYIEFNGVVDLKQVMIAINFYEGTVPAGPKGQIRLDLGGVTHEVDFHIRAGHGNKALGFPDKMARHPAWVVINAADIATGKLTFVGPAP